MCTVILAHRIVPKVPLIALANRDEFLSRPSLAPGVRDRVPRVFCGLDAREGGTWFGVNAFGLVVGLTNLTLRPPDQSRRSRGLLCLDMLSVEHTDQVHQSMLALESDAYNPFHLVALDGATAIRVTYDHSAKIESLPPGVHVTTNWPVGSEQDAKRISIENRVRNLLSTTPSIPTMIDGLKGEARRHEGDGDPRKSVCCHAPGYGTRASTLLLLGEGKVHGEHADGPPCETEYVDRSAEVGEMLSFKEF